MLSVLFFLSNLLHCIEASTDTFWFDSSVNSALYRYSYACNYISASSCGSDLIGDTILYIQDTNGNTLASNDDACGWNNHGSQVQYSFSGCKYFNVKVNCYSSTRCAATVTISFDTPPTLYPTAAPTQTFTTCSDGFSSSGSGSSLICIKCPANTYAVSGDSSCTACPANSFSVEGSGSCQCNSGYSQSGSGKTLSCGICPANTYSVATSCPPGYTYNPPTSSCYMLVTATANYFTAVQTCNSNY